MRIQREHLPKSALILVVLVASFTALVPNAALAQDLNAALSQAESEAAAAEAEIIELEAAVGPAENDLRSSARKAAPINAAASAAEADAERIQAQLTEQKRTAAAAIAKREADHRDEVDEHDREAQAGIGLGIAALIAAAIALSWGWFRASAAVAWFVRMPRGQAFGLCLGGGFLLLVCGAALSGADGAAGALGALVMSLGLVLPIAFLLARHSAEVQRGRERPLLGRDRLPRWVRHTSGATLGLLALLAILTAILSSEPERPAVSADLRLAAEQVSTPPHLVRAEGKAKALAQRASGLTAEREEDQEALRAARSKLAGAERRLAGAEREVDRFSSRLAALAAREAREAEKVRAREEREAEEEAEEVADETAEECDPSYSGACLDPNASDYDCEGGSGDGPLYTGPVAVVGSDHYGLDSDSDGYACEY